MNESRPRIPLAVIVLSSVLAFGAVLAASQTLSAAFSLGLYLAVSAVVFIDFIDFLVRYGWLRLRRRADPRATPATSIPLIPSDLTPYQRRLHLEPYALLVSVYNAVDELDGFLEAMAPYREHLWVIDDGSSDDTRLRLQQAGCRCIAGGANRKKPGALRALLDALPAAITTVVVLDPDCRILDQGGGRLSDLETVIFDFQQSGMAALCPRVAVADEGLLARFQSLEYFLACRIGRKSLVDCSVNSGVSVYRRSALTAALARHSLSVYAEDLENSLILLARGEGIYYDERLVIETEAVGSWRRWFSQRVGWSYGLLRVYATRFEEIRQIARRGWLAAYQYAVYLGGLSLLLHPFRLVALMLIALGVVSAAADLLGFSSPRPVASAYVLAAYLKYTWFSLIVLVAAVPRGERLRLLPVVPLYFWYALLQVVPQTVGYANLLSLRLWRRRLFQDHYQEEATLRREGLISGVSARGEMP